MTPNPLDKCAQCDWFRAMHRDEAALSAINCSGFAEPDNHTLEEVWEDITQLLLGLGRVEKARLTMALYRAGYLTDSQAEAELKDIITTQVQKANAFAQYFNAENRKRSS